MNATVALFVFRVSIPFCMNIGFLSTSVSDLLKSFASLIFAVFGLFSALTCAAGS